MSNCTDIRPVIGCFTPNNNLLENVSILVHTIYSNDEVPVGNAYTLVDDPENPIDISTYLGGGTITAGQCPIIQRDQVHNIVTGSNISVPSGLKSVTINNITGNTTISGGYVLGNGRRDNSISLNATELSEVRGLLPAITITGGTWQWIGIEPITE